MSRHVCRSIGEMERLRSQKSAEGPESVLIQPVVSVLGKLRQEDYCKFKASLG